MYFLYSVFSVCLLVLFVAGIFEQKRHFGYLNSIPERILVNGIRGKSSITRLCAGALRGGGVRTVAKTTGTAARFIWADASEVAVHRKFGLANVIEQTGVARRAASERPDAVVLECMAVDPALQSLIQDKLYRSTIGVICNVREDHLTEMGPTLEDVARNLSRTMPVDGVCVTAETELLPVLKREATKRNCRLICVDPESVTDEEMDRFKYFTFKENVAIALAVANQVGVGRDDALEGMWDSDPDPGVLTVESYHVTGKTLRFANVFAANDPRSTLMVFQQLIDSTEIRPPIFTLINCRPDRVERNRQMGEIIPELLASKLFVIGHPSRSAIESVPSSWDGKAFDLGGEGRDIDDIFRAILAEIETEASVVAVGNIHGQGELLLEYLERLGSLR